MRAYVCKYVLPEQIRTTYPFAPSAAFCYVVLQDYGVPHLDAHTARILWLPVMAILNPTCSDKYLLYCKFFTCEKSEKNRKKELDILQNTW